MTWRRFFALLRGFSPQSAFRDAMTQLAQNRRPEDNVPVITDSLAGERAVLSLLQGG